MIGCSSIVLAPELVLLMLGENWALITVCLQILIIGMVFKVTYKIFDSFIRAIGAVYQRAKIQALYALFVIIGSYVGSHWGIRGVAVAIAFAAFANYLLMLLLSAKFLSNNIALYIRLHIPLLLSVIAIMTPLYLCCLLYTSPSPRDLSTSRMPSSA